MWDNRCTQHRVVADNLSAYRRMERVTLIGDRPFLICLRLYRAARGLAARASLRRTS